ncbi:MAG: TonB-dependent receptor [Cyclobacteriaceae bacterium]
MKLNHIIIYILPLCLALPTLGQNSLSGKIINKETKLAIPFATISIPDLHAFATCDSSGNYHFEKIPAATYQVEVNALGYKIFSQIISVQGASIGNFELSESATELAEVVVTGSSKAVEIKKSPLSIASVNRQYLTTNISTNIIDAIARIPGVNAITTGPNVSKPVIRGLGFNRILTMYDGMRQEGQQWGDEHGIEMDNYAFDRIGNH